MLLLLLAHQPRLPLRLLLLGGLGAGAAVADREAGAWYAARARGREVRVAGAKVTG